VTTSAPTMLGQVQVGTALWVAVPPNQGWRCPQGNSLLLVSQSVTAIGVAVHPGSTPSSVSPPLLHQLLLLCKCANTTKCTPPCACVLAFHKYFSKELALFSQHHSILTCIQS
jgi:hypothetical protein